VPTANTWTTRAPFLIDNQWRWVKWTHHHGNMHAAIIEKGEVLGAQRWDFGQADHDRSDRFM